MNARFAPLARLTVVAASLMTCGLSSAQTSSKPALLEPALARQLAALPAQQAIRVVVTFRQSGPINTFQVASLKAMGIQNGVTMRSLPIMGAMATPAQIRALANRSDVLSIYRDAPLRFFNFEQNRSSSARRVTESGQDFGRGIPFSGKGVTVTVIDSGVDATNPDLPMGTKMVDNVVALPAAGLALADSLIGPGIVPVVFLQNQQNSDFSSGHGTHVAGTVGGTGLQSKGKHRGAAPGADIVGYGTGAAISILNAVVGLDYALTNRDTYRNPIRVTSNSWGTSADAFVEGQAYCDQPINVATYKLAQAGIVTVFAAGNDGSADNTHNPYARAPWVISVGAGEKDGVLTSFSSRGERDKSFDCTMFDGTKATFRNEPTIVASGVNIISSRAYTGALPALGAQDDATLLTPQELPFYTLSSGTSMATPHVSGVIALILEANPKLTPAQIKEVIQKTATNMTGRSRHEVGAGHLNAHAAVALAQAMAAGKTIHFGSTVKTMRFENGSAPKDRTFFATQNLVAGKPEDVTVSYAPAGANEGQPFEVDNKVLQVEARMTVVGGVGVELIDPKGNVYGSSIALPVLGDTVVASGPGMAGTWKVRAKGLRSYGGMQVAPPDSNGVGVPGSYTVKLSFTKDGGYTGLSDIDGHPQQKAIEYAVGKRLVDGYSTGEFKPDSLIRRSELAESLMLAASLRQSLPFNKLVSTSGLSPAQHPVLYPIAEAVTSRGAVLRDLTYTQDPVMPRQAAGFNPMGSVTQLDLAYTLVQALALQPQARAFTGEVTVVEGTGANATTVAVEVVDSTGQAKPLSQQQKGYVQLALNLGLLKTVRKEGNPKPIFEADKEVTRGAYAASVGRFQVLYQQGEDAQ